ncbi:MAG: hypothetical protein FJZ66_03980 [Bacteroidetes bacterium]|nr:hypothetical protein [Bacteroidota bacterium]
MRSVALLFLVCFYFSCSGNKDQEVLEGQTLFSEPKEIERTTKKIESKEFFDSSAYRKYMASDSIKLIGQVISVARSKKFLDRFALDSSLEIKVSINKKFLINHEVHFFKDSIQSKNAFYNWIDEEKHRIVGDKRSFGAYHNIFILTEKNFQIFNAKQKLNEIQFKKLATYFSHSDRIIFFLVGNKKETIWYNINQNNSIEEINEISK